MSVNKMASTVKWRVLAFCVIALAVKVEQVKSSAEVMKKMTIGFSKALDECKKDLNLGDHIMQDFFNFWKEDYQLLNNDVGCAIICIAGKFDLISEDNTLHHGNAAQFAKSHGADDDMAKQLVTIIHECENTHKGISDDCSRILEVAKCFRTKIHGLKWAPDMETVLEEVMIEVKS